jgi:hypothetical protein
MILVRINSVGLIEGPVASVRSHQLLNQAEFSSQGFGGQPRPSNALLQTRFRVEEYQRVDQQLVRRTLRSAQFGSAHGAWPEEEKTLAVRGFRGSLAIGIRALFYSRTSEANAQVRTSSELTFPYS